VLAPPLASIALTTARAAWPEVMLDDAVFLDHLERYAGGEPVGELDIAAIYLACACLHDEPHALASFEQHYLDAIPRNLARVTTDASLHDEVKQRLRIKLFVGPDPTITRYRRGSLAAWLRVVATRIAIDLLRAREQPMQEPPLELAALTDDANLALLKLQYRQHVELAFVAAIAALPPTDRAMLRLAFVDGLGLEGIGRIYQLSKSAVSRRLSRCRSELLADVKQRLGGDLGIAASELDSIVQLVRSQLHLSLPRLLAK
jgi:RNA polymerase sigma-70 factor (ECF subfamily)